MKKKTTTVCAGHKAPKIAMAPSSGSGKNKAGAGKGVGDEPLFFFMPNEPHGEFCQWFPATFTVEKDKTSALIGHPIDLTDPEGWSPIYFHCAEQFMMYCKAGCFNDTETQRKILATDDAKEQKRLGQKTRGFNASVWDKIKSDVVVRQNRTLRMQLLSTGDRVLAEAAKKDRVWGIGFTAQEATLHKDQSRWGENRLGKALMEVRSRLQEKKS